MVKVTEPTFIFHDDVSVDAFVDFSTAISRPGAGAGEGWAERYADFIGGELTELYEQHGPLELLLKKDKTPGEQAEIDNQHPELREWALDELSDMLWFDAMAARNLEISPIDAVSASLKRMTGEDTTLTSFDDIQDAALVSVNPAMADDPGTAYWEQTQALVRDLTAPEPADLALSVGDHLLSLAYVSKACLDLDLKDLARYNSYKLYSRQEYGKAASHLF